MLAETSYLSQGWEDLLWILPIFNFVLLFIVLVSLNMRMKHVDEKVMKFDIYVINALGQVLYLLGQNAQNATVVAQDLADRTKRADESGFEAGEAADAASKSP